MSDSHPTNPQSASESISVEVDVEISPSRSKGNLFRSSGSGFPAAAAAIFRSRRTEDIGHGPGYSIWKFSAELSLWTMIVDQSQPGHVAAPAPKHVGKFHGEILRLVSIIEKFEKSR